MFHSLYIKLVLVLFVLFLGIGAVFLFVAMYTAPMYQQEVSQQLNRDLANYIVKEHVLIEDGQVRRDNLEQLFHNVMIINPSLELYLLDADGRVIAHSMEPDRVQRRQVSLAPINRFLEQTDDGLIMGVGFTVVLVILGGMRELAGTGALFANMDLLFGPDAVDWKVVVIPDYQPFLLAILPPGAFIFTGLIIAVKNLIDGVIKRRQAALKDKPVKGAKRVRVTGAIS